MTSQRLCSPRLAFPYDDYPPTPLTESHRIRTVAAHVALQFRIPVAPVADGPVRRLAASMLMPETAVYENNRAMSSQYDIWFAWQHLRAQPETKAKFVQGRPDRAFGRSVRCTHLSHDGAALRLRENVSHYSSASFLPVTSASWLPSGRSTASGIRFFASASSRRA